jgi:hypothetical protein
MSSVHESVELWRRIIIGGAGKSWVLFEHGTCVVLVQSEGDLAERAVGILRRYGPVQIGSPAADFGVIHLDREPGWVVTGHHPDVLNHVPPGEDSQPSDLVVGMIGRTNRDRDGRELTVVHVEDNRS